MSGQFGACAEARQVCGSNGFWESCRALAVASPEICGNDLDEDCDGQVDNSCPVRNLNPDSERHWFFKEVVSGSAFQIPLWRYGYDPHAITLRESNEYQSRLRYDPNAQTLSGMLRHAGVYELDIEVCTVQPYDPVACLDPRNRQLDKGHLTVVSNNGFFSVKPELSYGSMRLVQTTLDVSSVKPNAEFPDRTELWVFYPETSSPRSFPVVLFAHGNSYHPRDYQVLGQELARRGMMLAIPYHEASQIVSSSVQSRTDYLLETIEWLKTGEFINAEPDLDKLFLMGHSWGGTAATRRIQDFPARGLIVIDPVDVMFNMNTWIKGADFDGRPRRVHTPILLLDAEESLFTSLPADFRGLYPETSVVYVSFAEASLEDIIDYGADGGRFSRRQNPQRSSEFQEATAELIQLFVERYGKNEWVNNSLLYSTDLAHHLKSFYSSGVTIAQHKYSGSSVVIDDAAGHELAPIASEVNSLGLVRSIVADESLVSLPYAALSSSSPYNSSSDAVRMEAREYLEQSPYHEFHLSADNGEIRLWQGLGGLDGQDMSAIRFDLNVADDRELRIELTLSDNRNSMTKSKIFSFASEKTQTISFPIREYLGIDTSQLASMEIRIKASDGLALSVSVDHVRLEALH